MKAVVDGDNAPGANIKGINMLGSEDSVYIYYASDNKYFRRTDKQEAVLRMAKCPVTFTSIPAADNAVDFAIAMDLKSIVDSNPSEVVALVSDDRHFRTILTRAKDITQSSGIYQVSDIEEAVRRYKVLESASLQDLHNYLLKSFGQEKGCEFYGKVDKLFAQKHQGKSTQPNNTDAGIKGSSAWKRMTETLRTRILSAERGLRRSPFGNAVKNMTAGISAILKP